MLRLRAEMKLPGRRWLELSVRPGTAGSRLCHTVAYDPKGLAGIAYWYALYPIHGLVFGRMLKGIARAAESGEGDGRRPA